MVSITRSPITRARLVRPKNKLVKLLPTIFAAAVAGALFYLLKDTNFLKSLAPVERSAAVPVNKDFLRSPAPVERSAAVPVNGDLMLKSETGYGATEIWREILEEGQQLKKETNAGNGNGDVDGINKSISADPPWTVIEVGANDAKQAIEIAKYGFNAHSVEPSPKSFQRMIDQVEKEPLDIRERIFIYNAAAGDSSEGTIDFLNTGSTGDHVGGGIDSWLMTKSEVTPNVNAKNTVKVKSIRMDSFFNNELKPDHNASPAKDVDGIVFAAKIDTQGFEPKVFEGMRQAVEQRKIHFIMTEFWPKGINLMNDYSEKCKEAIEYLYMIHDAGYILYSAPIMAHPRASGYWFIKRLPNRRDRPFHNLKEDCLGMYKLEEKFSDKDYHMGYWTDIIAVSPDAKLPRNPVSFFGEIVMKSMENAIIEEKK